MSIAYRQGATLAETSGDPGRVGFPVSPMDGSALILAVGLSGTGVPISIDQLGANWNLLEEASTGELTDEGVGTNARVQIWAAFDIKGSPRDVRIIFPSGVSERGFILAEYTGDVFRFPNPADRVIGDVGETVGPGVGSLDSGIGGETREASELWVCAAVCSKVVTITNPQSPFSIRSSEDIGDPQSGTVALLDAFTSSADAARAIVDHTTGSQVRWAITMAAIRGVLQTPFDAQTAPSSNDPVTENDDHAGDAIGHLLEQFKSHDKR